MRVNQAFRRSQQGLTLVEMMVAMTIGLVLLGGVITVLTSSQQTYRVNEALARMQENARYAFQFLSRDIRMAGYWGCGGYTVAGYESLKGTETANNGPDTLTVRGVEGDSNQILSHSHSSSEIKVASIGELKANDMVLVSDCEGAVIYQVTAINGKTITHDDGSGTTGNSPLFLSRAFPKGEVAKISTRIYDIRSKPALYWKRGNQSADELVEGIENMQIQYGEDTDGDRAVDIYRTADLVADWENVVSVRIDLLVRSVEDNVTSQPQTYTFNGETVTPTDRRLRQAFSTVISLRNRAP